MKAIAYYQSLPIQDPNALQDIELPEPVAGPRDVLVEVKAISVNPVDTKIRQNVTPENGAAKVLGWDVAGVVKAVGSGVSSSVVAIARNSPIGSVGLSRLYFSRNFTTVRSNVGAPASR